MCVNDLNSTPRAHKTSITLTEPQLQSQESCLNDKNRVVIWVCTWTNSRFITITKRKHG